MEMSQAELARLLKVSPQTGHTYETYDLEKRIRTFLKEKQRKMSDLSRHIGMTEAGMRRMFANHNCTNTTLIKIADFFDLPVSELLPHNPRTAEDEAKAKQIHFLKGQLNVYRTTIFTLVHGETEG